MRVSDLDYELPEELIAQKPLTERSASRLMVVNKDRSHFSDVVRSLPSLLPPSLFVVNETRVIPARLFGQKSTGGRCELLLLEPIPRESMGVEPKECHWRTLGTANKPLKAGTALTFGDTQAVIEKRNPGGVLEVRFLLEPKEFDAFLSDQGQMPLPPYITRDTELADQERYQTVFAKTPGAAAAPTAGLHFDNTLLAELADAGHKLTRVCLHVGPGTFRPVQSERLEDHTMHEERYFVSEETAELINRAKSEATPIVAVGTTVVRTLESAQQNGKLVAGEGKTNLFIKPGFVPRIVDHLFTNFHLPRSTLLALVMAFGGQSTIRAAYARAVEEQFRFFSYGDAMLIRNEQTRGAS